MIINKILEIVLFVFSIIIIPIQAITTFVLGILVRITFGLLLIPMSIVWIVCFLSPLVALSYVYEKLKFLRIIVGIIGIPIAIIGNIYISLMPSMGEKNERVTKMLFSNIFPFTWHLYLYTRIKTNVEFTNGYIPMLKLMDTYALTSGNLWRDCVININSTYNVKKKYL